MNTLESCQRPVPLSGWLDEGLVDANGSLIDSPTGPLATSSRVTAEGASDPVCGSNNCSAATVGMPLAAMLKYLIWQALSTASLISRFRLEREAAAIGEATGTTFAQ